MPSVAGLKLGLGRNVIALETEEDVNSSASSLKRIEITGNFSSCFQAQTRKRSFSELQLEISKFCKGSLAALPPPHSPAAVGGLKRGPKCSLNRRVRLVLGG